MGMRFWQHPRSRCRRPQRKFLGIVKQGAEGGGDAAGQHDGGGQDWAGERATADFVDAGDPAVGICDAGHGADCTSERPESRGRFFTRG